MFIPIEMPHCLAFGAVATNGWSTVIAETEAGYEQRTQEWTQWRNEYDLPLPPTLPAEFEPVRDHFAMVRGMLHSFPMKDWSDFTVSAAQSVVSYVSPGAFQFGKRYGVAPYAYDRKLTRFAGAVQPLRGGVPMVAGGGAGQYAFNADTGVLTVQPDQTRSITSHVVGATHRLNLASDFSPNVSPGGIIYVSGVSGTAAALLNGLPLTVATVAAGYVTVNVNTTGLTATGGTAARRIAASEITYTATQFMVPVRYDVDKLAVQAINRKGGDLILQTTGLRAVEVRE